MNPEKRHAEMLDHYMDALLQNPDAPIPSGLDPLLAAFAREMVLAEQSIPTPAPIVQARVWQQTLMAVQQEKKPSTNGHAPIFTPTDPFSEEKTMQATIYSGAYLSLRKPRWEYSITLLAAILTVILFGGFYLAAYFSNDDPRDSEAVIPAASDNPTDIAALPEMWGGATPINIGDSVTGSLTAEFPAQSYIFSAFPGQVIQVAAKADDLIEVSHSFVSTPDPNATSGGGGGGGGSAEREVVFSIPIEFESQVVVTITNAARIEVNNYALSIGLIADAGVPVPVPPNAEQQALAVPQPIMREQVQIGETIDGTLTEENPVIAYSFVAIAGQIVAVNITADQPIIVAQSITTLSQIGSANNGGGGGGGGGGSPTREINLVLPFSVDSQAEIQVIADKDALPANFTLTLTPTTADQVTYGESVEGNLAVGQYIQYFEFQGRRGDVVHLTVDSEIDNDLRLRLVDTDSGATLAEDDDSGHGYLPEIQNFQLGHSGTYRVEVEAFSYVETEAIPFTLNIDLDTVPVSADGTSQIISLSSKQHIRIATFEAVAGEQYRLIIAGATPEFPLTVTVLQNGETLALMGLGQDAEMSTEFTIPPSENPVDNLVVISINGGSLDPNYFVNHSQITLTLESLSE